MATEFDRRAFLRRGGVGAMGLGLVLGGGSLLAACGDDDDDSNSASSATGTSKSLGELALQLSWIKNSEFAGSYFADQKGYYTAAGFSKVSLISGGPSVTQDAVVQSGKALVGISAPDITAAAVNKGAELVIIGAQYQKNPFCVMSLASNPINTPEDMKGKKIGVQATNEAVWAAFLQANDIDPSSINKVTVEFNPQPLTTGEVDGWFSFVTNEPNLLKVQGIDTVTFLLNDYKYPLVSETYMVKKDTLDKEPDKLKAFLMAEIKGWRDVLKDPDTAAKYTVEIYGKDLKLEQAEQKLEVEAESKLIYDDDAQANGLFTITQKKIDDSIATMKLGGIDITADKLFDTSLIDSIYKDNPDLKAPVS